MKPTLPIGIESLLSGAVERPRLELKASWDPRTTGWQVLHLERSLERLTRMEAPTNRQAWAWLDLASVRRQLSKPASSVQDALDRAAEMAHDDLDLQQQLEKARIE